MNNKKAKTRFTIQFSRFDPSHIQVAEILNRQAMRGKAQYIVNAVKFYESFKDNHNETSAVKRFSDVNESSIESIVDRILTIMDKMLLDRAKKGTGTTPVAMPLRRESSSRQESIGATGFNAVASTLDMFRNRQK